MTLRAITTTTSPPGIFFNLKTAFPVHSFARTNASNSEPILKELGAREKKFVTFLLRVAPVGRDPQSTIAVRFSSWIVDLVLATEPVFRIELDPRAGSMQGAAWKMLKAIALDVLKSVL